MCFYLHLFIIIIYLCCYNTVINLVIVICTLYISFPPFIYFNLLCFSFIIPHPPFLLLFYQRHYLPTVNHHPPRHPIPFLNLPTNKPFHIIPHPHHHLILLFISFPPPPFTHHILKTLLKQLLIKPIHLIPLVSSFSFLHTYHLRIRLPFINQTHTNHLLIT